MSLRMQLFILVLLPMAFLLSPRVQAGEIIGGQEASPHSRPYMAHLQIATRTSVKMCGGFLIRDDVVLTAAHCNNEWGNIIVSLGVHDLRSREQSWQVIPVRCRIPHPQYNTRTLNNDIMLMQVGQHMWPGTICSVAGWGRTSAHYGQSSPTLQEAVVTVLEGSACWRIPGLGNHYYNLSTMVCAGDLKQGRSSYKGDSGGPLVCGGKAQGIVSWGSEDGTPPAVYTRVSTFIPWILEMMRKLET